MCARTLSCDAELQCVCGTTPLRTVANVRLRDALVGVLRVMPVLMVVVHMYFYILLTTCNGLSYVWAPAASSPNASANASAVANTSHVVANVTGFGL
jgi:hypothetical protein